MVVSRKHQDLDLCSFLAQLEVLGVYNSPEEGVINRNWGTHRADIRFPACAWGSIGPDQWFLPFWRSSESHAGTCPLATMTSEVVENELEFYSKAKKYWKDVPATVDGMLGGYGHISSIDINSSRKFLQRFLRDGPNRTGTTRALDCGAGIGRITKRLLLPLFKTVDMVDVTEDFLTKAKSYLGEEGRRVRNYFCCGLQDFSPEPNTYDVIWIQWVIGHLTDNHLSDFLKRCRAGLRPNGIVVIKDNMAQEGVIMDDVDSSVCRDLDVVRKIIRRAGLHLLAEERQENFPDEIYHVYTFAMR